MLSKGGLSQKGQSDMQKILTGETILTVIDLLMGLLRGAIFRHGGVPESSPLASMRRFPSLMGRFPALMGCFPNALMGRFPS